MKTTVLLFALAVSPLLFSQGQEDQINLEKYWQYRDRFRQEFTKIGAQPGESLSTSAGSIQRAVAIKRMRSPFFKEAGRGNIIYEGKEFISC